MVKGVSPGTATIRAYSTETGKYTTLTVKVVEKSAPAATDVSFPNLFPVLVQGEKLQLDYDVVPAGGTGLVWNSERTSVATVDSNGVVTAKAPGYAYINATTKDGKQKATCFVTVLEKPVTTKVTGISFKTKTPTIEVGESITVEAAVSPANATNQGVWYTSKSKAIATCNYAGVVKGVAPGTATIRAYSTETGKYTTLTVKVVEKSAPVATEVSFPNLFPVLVQGENLQLDYDVVPANGTGLVWNSERTSVATVDANGVVTAKAPGYAYINATTRDGKQKATCFVTVLEKPVTTKVTGISFETKTPTIEVGESITVKAAVSPANATNQGVWYTSKSKAIATCNYAGVVKGVAPGTATIRAYSTETGKYTTLTVKVVATDTYSIGILTGTGVNVREKASTSSTSLGKLDKNDVVVITKENAAQGWHQIDYNGEMAYISADYIKIDEDQSALKAIVQGVGVNVRENATTASTSLGKLNTGDVIYVTKKNYTSGWHQFVYQNQWAYISSDYVQF